MTHKKDKLRSHSCGTQFNHFGHALQLPLVRSKSDQMYPFLPSTATNNVQSIFHSNSPNNAHKGSKMKDTGRKTQWYSVCLIFSITFTISISNPYPASTASVLAFSLDRGILIPELYKVCSAEPLTILAFLLNGASWWQTIHQLIFW